MALTKRYLNMKNLRHLLLITAALTAYVTTASAQRWSVSANAADMANLGTISIEGSYAAGRHISVNASAEVNPWTFRKGEDDQFQDRKQTYAAGVRWWPWNAYSGWWVSGKAQYQEYNKGGLINEQTREGDAFGLGVGAGYSLMLGKNINIDFGLGLWGGYDIYTTYACPNCGKVVDSGDKWFFLPNELVLAIMWIF